MFNQQPLIVVVVTAVLVLATNALPTPNLKVSEYSVSVALDVQIHTSNVRAGGCSFSVANDVPSPEPILVLSKEPSQTEIEATLGLAPSPPFLAPPPDSNDDIILLDEGEAIIVSCPGNGNHLVNVDGGPQEVEATCASGSSLLINGQEYEMERLACKSNSYNSLVLTEKECAENGQIFDIGFQLQNKFVTAIQGCFDTVLKTVIWTNYTLVGGIGGHKTGVARPSWIGDYDLFDPINPNDQYSRNTEQDTIGQILGSADLGTKYVKSSGDYFLSRGHTTAKADFVLASLQRATFHIVNAAPQWQTFNGGNWNTLENNLRTYVEKLGRDVKVWTGYHHISQLPDVNGDLKDLYLYTDENNNNALPIPRHFWKAIYDPETQTGIVVIGHNNPYTEDNMPPMCESSGNGQPPSWITWKNSNDPRLGVLYWCTIESFRSTMGFLPDLPDKGVFGIDNQY